jgi:hypothetical protein
VKNFNSGKRITWSKEWEWEGRGKLESSLESNDLQTVSYFSVNMEASCLLSCKSFNIVIQIQN